MRIKLIANNLDEMLYDVEGDRPHVFRLPSQGAGLGDSYREFYQVSEFSLPGLYIEEGLRDAIETGSGDIKKLKIAACMLRSLWRNGDARLIGEIEMMLFMSSRGCVDAFKTWLDGVE
ncbi:MAG: hypothetical protein GY841_02890 [FCB group bacterium]|nr:hypothetical protein [FCB group bacterium]